VTLVCAPTSSSIIGSPSMFPFQYIGSAPEDNSKLGLLLGQASPTASANNLSFADHRHGLEIEVAKLFPGGSRTSARWRSRRRSADCASRHGQDGCRWDRP
jgi:hypothetical protein